MRRERPRSSKRNAISTNKFAAGRSFLRLSILAIVLNSAAILTRANPAGTIHYPDLEALPPSDVGIEYDPGTGQKFLRFTVSIANLGQGPLEVMPVNNATTGTTDAYQHLYSHDNGGNWYIVSSVYVGTFEFHPAHNHWHFDNFARYELRNVASDGSVGTTVLASNQKVSFCIRDDLLVNGSLQHAASSETYTNCDQVDPQGISVGWADVYPWTLPDQNIDITGIPDGDYWLVATADPINLLNEGGGAAESNNTASVRVHIGSDVVWFDDAVPAGAATGAYNGDSWKWVSSNPAPFAGRLAHQSAIKAGSHQHFFYGATATLAVSTNNILFTYVYLDPANPPGEVMIQWSDGYTWEHRAYWGANNIALGNDGTASRRRVGPLPATGRWVRLEVPANLVGLEGSALSGMSFVLYNGRATWDYTGVNVGPADPSPPPDTTPPTVAITTPANGATVSGAVTVTASASDDVSVAGVQFKLDGANLGVEATAAPYSISWNTTSSANGSHTLTALARDAAGNQSASSPLTVTVNNTSQSGTVWVDESVPAGAWTGADGGDAWNWITSNPTPFSGSLAHQSTLAPGIHYHYFTDATATLSIAPGDTLFTYVYVDPAHPPREILLRWFDGVSWAHAAYWGENLIPWGSDGTASQRPMGGLPAPGQWVRLDVPASLVDLEGRTLSGMNYVLYDGQTTWDDSGK